MESRREWDDRGAVVVVAGKNSRDERMQKKQAALVVRSLSRLVARDVWS